jgi:hypothetical protein
MTTIEQHLANGSLRELERVVEMLSGQLRVLQQELHQATGWSSAWQLRNNWLSLRRNHLFMSAICNRRIRPNTKQPSHGAPRTSHGPVAASPCPGC